MSDELREVKDLMVSASNHLVRKDVVNDRRALDEMRLALQLLIGLVEGHRHATGSWVADGGGCKEEASLGSLWQHYVPVCGVDGCDLESGHGHAGGMTGPMQAAE